MSSVPQPGSSPHGKNLVFAGQFPVQAVDARRTEEIQAVIADLPLHKLILVERLPTEGTPFCVDLFGWFSLLDHGLEPDNRNSKDNEDESNRQNGNGHGRPML